MFTHPEPSIGVNTASSSPATAASSSSRVGRLRGLSYLRNYTQNHLLSRDIVGSPSSKNNSPPSSGAAFFGSSSSSSSHRSARPTSTRAATHSPPSGRRRSRLASPASDALLLNPPRNHARQASAQTIASAVPDVSSEARLAHLAETNSESVSDQDRQLQHEQSAGDSGNDLDMTRTRSATTGDLSMDMLPTIRFSAHYDARSNRQSLSFTPVSRTLPTGKETIKVGRYSEREQQAVAPANVPSAAPVGFKSKVVSRRHCEFWFEGGKWYIKDAKSSSGTFLNHIRLSPPGTESKPYIVNDGDIVQLGIDFRGGEEMIFRCVKMRVELNRGWQNKPNNFNVATYKLLKNLTSTTPNASHTLDCSICLNAIAPCQSLFYAPCSHTWHYKCIRELLMGPSYPIFTCPNCRAAADLDADVEEPSEDWQQLDSEAEAEADVEPPPVANNSLASSLNVLGPGNAASSRASSAEDEAADVTMLLDSPPLEPHQQSTSRHAVSSPVPIPNPTVRASSGPLSSARSMRTPSPNRITLVNGTEGPLTPRNDAGPWVFDGDAGRASQEAARQGAMGNLDATAAQVESNMA